jgi:hypothetical protein
MVASPTVSLTTAGASAALGVPVDLHAWAVSAAATLSIAITVFIERPPFGCGLKGHSTRVWRPPAVGADTALIMRRVLAGMLQSEQVFHYDVGVWLEVDSCS